MLYGVLTIGSRYGWTKWEDWLANQEGGYEEVPKFGDAQYLHAF